MGDSSFASGFKTGFGSAFLQFALERFATFGSFAWREIGLIWGVEDELRKLHRTFLKVRDLMDHIETSPLRFMARPTNAWQVWFEDLRKLAYDADALLDHISLHLSTYCSKNPAKLNQEAKVFSMVVSSFSEMNLPHKMCEMQEKLDELTKEMESLVMMDRGKCAFGSTTLLSGFRPSVAFLDDGDVVGGRRRDKECLVDLVMDEGQMGNLSIVSVVGMGGIGKTTLARLVFDDGRVCDAFGSRVWVSVSMDFDLVRIMRSVIEYETRSPCELSDLNAIQNVVHGLLRNRKFLLVLDDYWSENEDEWCVLRSLFRFGSKGSKIIVTTRSARVSSIVRSSVEYKLEILSDDDCWTLIKQSAFADVEMNQDFEAIGMQIANKCKGLPLVATMLGSVLHRKRTEAEWRSVLENELWDLPHDKNVFLTLILSYIHLPPHLQKCFTYCSIFPQNYEFQVEELVLLWMAEGFIQPVGSQRLEDLGRDYFDDLYSRSFFQQSRSTSNEIKYKMHDLIRDMARLVSKDICFLVKYTMSNCYPLFGNVCHLSLLHASVEPLSLKATRKNERLRTFLVMSNGAAPTGEVDPQLFQNLQFLRTLDLSRVGLTELAGSIDKLEYLRYLNLSENPILYLPESMCKLVALQTLKLRNCSQLRELPKNMWNLSNLRHLDLDIRRQLQFMPLQFGRLTNLQTLSAYIIGKRKGHGIEELKDMNCLKGSLCIKNMEHVSDITNVVEASLDKKTYLDSLELQWRKLSDGLNSQVLNQRRSEQAEIFANLKPHENLKVLIVQNYCGVVCPDWLSESSRRLTSIHLQGLKYCDNLPALGQLPFLKSFFISDMPSLVYVDHTFYGTSNGVKFPSLEFFEVRRMSMLIHWRNTSENDMPCLDTFSIHDCPNLISLPLGLQDLLPTTNVSNCPSLQLLP